MAADSCKQSPLSRAIKEQEQHLGVHWFERTTRCTNLTWVGKVFLDEALRIFACIDQAKASVKTAATGYHGRLRIAVFDGIAQPHLSALLAQCRTEEPEVEIRLSEVPLSQQIKGLNSDLFDAGFAQSDEVGEGIIAEVVWSDAKKIRKAGLTGPAGIFLGLHDGQYLRHEGPEHLLTFPPTHSGKGAIQHGVPGGHVKRGGNPPPLASGRWRGEPSKPTRPLRPAAGRARRRPVAREPSRCRPS